MCDIDTEHSYNFLIELQSLLPRYGTPNGTKIIVCQRAFHRTSTSVSLRGSSIIVTLHINQRSAAHLSAFCCTSISVLLHIYQRSAAHLSAFCCTSIRVLLLICYCSAADLLAFLCALSGVPLHTDQRSAGLYTIVQIEGRG